MGELNGKKKQTGRDFVLQKRGMTIITIKDREGKYPYNGCSDPKSIWASFGAIEGIVSSYKNRYITAEVALRDINKVVTQFNEAKDFDEEEEEKLGNNGEPIKNYPEDNPKEDR